MMENMGTVYMWLGVARPPRAKRETGGPVASL